MSIKQSFLKTYPIGDNGMRSKLSLTTMHWLRNITMIFNLAFLFLCCALFQTSNPSSEKNDPEHLNKLHNKELYLQAIEKKYGSLAALQQQLRDSAYSILGAKSLTAKGKKFNYDCVGVVQAIYYLVGIDLSKALQKHAGNGVTRLFNVLDDEGLLYETEHPQTGDLIFWDNTWDRNNDGKWNDYLTHIGMVVNTDKQGMIEYIHHNYRKGIIIEKMNLAKPDVHVERVGNKYVEINAPMRMQGSGPKDDNRWLASQLYRIFGLAYFLKESG
jgi:hypothetical protein